MSLPDARPLSVLTIAGSDSGGGAGIQTDLKTLAAHCLDGLSAIAALTAQQHARRDGSARAARGFPARADRCLLR